MELGEWGEISDGHGGPQGMACPVRFRMAPRSFTPLLGPKSPS
ncbi:hypothetical protein MFUM_1030016 [Methylacidiphilum fumariolicum SolV]|uniref:Uncharacterized protein n=2 Tax=Candidatus Methylacidiphilum fumarolicum TaxID=591154 RepID=I0JW14_METFB|nr:conserved protein of unknown function [Candidatus Methylacidiphilum fumarolicum]CCG91433.1 hypothetical protein MFUM_1030016 [Methylacidiphilum fumariolicum SolV]